MAGDDAPYIAYLRTRPCAVQPCNSFGVTGHHSTNGETERHAKSLGGRRGKGQRASDRHAFSLCIKHHAEFHDEKGHFRDWTREQRRAWQDEMVRVYRARYEAETADGAPKPGAAVTKALAAPVANDPRTVAREFCRERGLGDQIAFDLERLLRSFERSF